MTHDDRTLSALERELQAALADRAARITPSDRWEEIETMVTTTNRQRRWPIVLLAAAAVLAVVAGIFTLRPKSGPTTVASPSPSGSMISSPTPSPSLSPSPSPSASDTSDAPDDSPTDLNPIGGTVPVYYISYRVHDMVESGLGLRRYWVSAETPDTPQARAKAALVAALTLPADTEGGTMPWVGVGLQDLRIGSDRIEIVLDRAPTTDMPEGIAALAVQQLVWTAQAAVGQGNLPVHISTADRQPGLWSTSIRDDFLRPPGDHSHAILTDLWITEPSYPAGGTAVVKAGDRLTVSGVAAVFEANVQWELTNEAGTVVNQGTVTASAGAPARGTFAIDLTVPRTSGHYTVRAYSLSMKDGGSAVADDMISLTVR